MIAFEWLLFIFKRKYQIFSKLHCWNVASHKLRLKFSQETGNEKKCFCGLSRNRQVSLFCLKKSIWNKIILGLSENHSLVNFTRKASWPHQIWHFQKRWSSVAKLIWYNLVHKLCHKFESIKNDWLASYPSIKSKIPNRM